MPCFTLDDQEPRKEILPRECKSMRRKYELHGREFYKEFSSFRSGFLNRGCWNQFQGVLGKVTYVAVKGKGIRLDKGVSQW